MGQFEDFKGKTFGGLGGNGNGNGEGQKQKSNGNAPTTVDAPEVPNNDYYEYVVNVVKKTVKQEDALIRQILNTAFSADFIITGQCLTNPNPTLAILT